MNKSITKFESILAKIIDRAAGDEDLKDAPFVQLIRAQVPLWARCVGVKQDDLLEAMEKLRNSAPGIWYSEDRLPLPDAAGVVVYESLDEFKLVCSSHRFRCPSCNEISHEPFFCSSEAKPKCNWKAYGLQGCLGKGHRFAIKDTFLANPKVHEIFMPVELEH